LSRTAQSGVVLKYNIKAERRERCNQLLLSD
jgi:hypothetical protein